MGVSMEEFGPISVDYFHGRRVLRVEEGNGGEGLPYWSIYFEADGVIHNYDPTIPAPKTIVGAGLTMTILGAHADPVTRKPITELRFGLETVKLNPLEYAISDPLYTKGELVYAQRSRANMPMLPPDPSADRIAEGPSQEWLDEQERIRKAAEAEDASAKED